MGKIEQLNKRKSELLAQMRALSDAAIGDDGNARAFTDEETAKYSELSAGVEQVNTAIERERELEAAEARAAQPAKNEPRISITRAENHDDKGEYRGFRSLGEQLLAVAAAGSPGGAVDKRLGEIRASASGLNEGTEAEGGFLVQSDFMVEMIRNVYNAGAVASRCRRVTLGPNSNRLELVTVDETSRADGSRFGGVLGYWRAEAATVTAKKPGFRNMRITVEDLMALCYVTEEMLQDATAIQSIISQAFTEEFAFLLDDAIINGNGAGKPLGILNSDALVSVTKEGSQTADTVVFGNVSKMRSRMWTRGLTNAVWLCNQEVLPQLEQLYVAVGTAGGIPVFMPAGQRGGEQETLYSRPVLPIEQLPKLGDQGDLLFADLSQYLLVEKGTIDAQSSIHVKFIYGETAFRWLMRVNGQPLLAKAITPYKGTTGVTYSPFVVTDARA
jgi:HK97 family phage major capsid protein